MDRRGFSGQDQERGLERVVGAVDIAEELPAHLQDHATMAFDQRRERGLGPLAATRDESKKAAEANLIVRREETAAMRSQANTAKLLQDNPTLMRLRELEVLEKVAASAKLSVVLGDKGLTERVVNVL